MGERVSPAHAHRTPPSDCTSSPREPYYADPSGTVTAYWGDCLDVMRRMAASSVDVVVTDPPYSLSFMGRAWDTHDSPLAFQQWCTEWATEALGGDQ